MLEGWEANCVCARRGETRSQDELGSCELQIEAFLSSEWWQLVSLMVVNIRGHHRTAFGDRCYRFRRTIDTSHGVKPV